MLGRMTLPQALDTLQTVWGYPEFRGVQAEVVSTLLAGEHALVLMPTGGGKSLCYQLPSLLRPGCGVVVSPLIALMKDQVDTLRQLGVRAAFLNSSLPPAEAAAVEADFLRGALDLLYLAPERLLQPQTLRTLARADVALFAVDEAHCVSQWGHDFRPEYQGLGVLAEEFPDVPRLALTATADERTREDIRAVLRLQGARQFVSSFDRPNIRYTVGNKAGPKGQLLDFIRREHPLDAGIVYCLSRRSVEETAAWLREQELPAVAYHAGLSPQERSAAQDRFLNEEGQIVVATVAFGMGIDKPNVRFVAHLDLPGSVEAYYQETGRAGRDGLSASAWMVYGLSDVVNRRRMIRGGGAPASVQRVELAKLEALLSLCEGADCRRAALLRTFGEAHPGTCGNCDNCLNPPRSRDATREAQMVLSAAVRAARHSRGLSFGGAHLTDILRGEASEKVVAQGHHRLPTFGVGKDTSAAAWRDIVRQLVSLGYLEAGEHFGLNVTARAGPLLRGEERLTLREEVLAPRSRGEKHKRAAAPAGLAEADAGLFGALREWRLLSAREQGVPPYVIFSDATLRAVAQARPRTPAGLLSISGVGEKKLHAYGAEVLAVVARFAEGGESPDTAAGLLDAAESLSGAGESAPEPAPAGEGAPESAPPAPGAPAPDSDSDTPRHAALRELRRELAREEGIPAYRVYPNRTLLELAARAPQTLAELAGIPGLGDTRRERYGERIVAALQGHE